MMHERNIMNGSGMFNSVFIWMGVFLVITMALIVIGIVLIVRSVSKRDMDQYQQRTQTIPSTNEQAIRILKERLAKGEINTEEYDDLRLKIENS